MNKNKNFEVWANEGEQGEQMGGCFLLANEAGGKRAPGWIEVPFGNHDHREGMQIFNAAAGRAMVELFDANKAAKGARFKGIPIYLGHADDVKLAGGNGDKRARGWIREMAATESALRLKTDWTPLGRHEVEDEEVAYFSPRWAVTKIAEGGRNYRPVRLISLGLVNDPNIEGILPLTNERENDLQGKPAGLPPWVHGLAGTDPETAGEDEVKQALQAKVEAAGQLEAARQARAALEAAVAQHDAAMGKLQKTLANERERAERAEGGRAALAVEKLVVTGRITLAEKAGTLEALSNAGEEFEAVEQRFTNRAPVLSLGECRTRELGRRRGEADAAQAGESTRQVKVIEMVNERMTRTGEAYQSAWANVRREHPALFDEMKQPSKSQGKNARA